MRSRVVSCLVSGFVTSGLFSDRLEVVLRTILRALEAAVATVPWRRPRRARARRHARRERGRSQWQDFSAHAEAPQSDPNAVVWPQLTQLPSRMLHDSIVKGPDVQPQPEQAQVAVTFPPPSAATQLPRLPALPIPTLITAE